MLDQEPFFSNSVIGAPLTLALELDADLVECALKTDVSIPALPNNFLSQPETVEETTGLCGLRVLRSN